LCAIAPQAGSHVHQEHSMTDVTSTASCKLIDIGANLTHDSFEADRDAVISRAQAAGVCGFIVTGSDTAHSGKALKLSHAYPRIIYATAGVHPHHAKDCTPGTADELRDLLAHPEVVAVGECGLDYFRNFSPPEIQREMFELQLKLAVETGKPVFLHQRDAHGDFLAILRLYRPRLSRAVVHCFTGTTQELRDYLELDCHIGITGWICDERRGQSVQESVKLVPADKLMIETDAPYLIPRDLRPKPPTHRNEPVYLPHICAVVARHLGKTSADVARQTSHVTRRFFTLPADAMLG
jgi:TatD DNase family protein